MSQISRWQSDAGTLQLDDLVCVQINSNEMLLGGEGVRVYPRDEVVVERDGLHFIGDGAGVDAGQLVEGEVHGEDVQFTLLTKVVADLLNVVLMNVQPVERPWIDVFE